MGQFDIDTTEVLFRRYKYNIDLKSNDSTLHSVLTKYEGGLYHRKDFLTKGEEELVYLFKLKNPKDSVDLDVLRLNLYSQISYRKAWRKYDEENFIFRDSTVFDKPTETKIFDFYPERNIDENNQLVSLTTIDGGDKEIIRNTNGEISKIVTSKEGWIKKVEFFSNGLLAKVLEYHKNKLGFEILFEYDSHNRLISQTKGKLKTFFEYFDSKVIKKTIWIPRNIEKDRTVYKYDSQGHLTEETLYYGDRIAGKSIYITTLN